MLKTSQQNIQKLCEVKSAHYGIIQKAHHSCGTLVESKIPMDCLRTRISDALPVATVILIYRELGRIMKCLMAYGGCGRHSDRC